MLYIPNYWQHRYVNHRKDEREVLRTKVLSENLNMFSLGLRWGDLMHIDLEGVDLIHLVLNIVQ
jgi:hypothetical protein